MLEPTTIPSQKTAAYIYIDRSFRASGLLSQISPEDLQTLICLLTYADEHGTCLISARDVAGSLGLSERQGGNRLKRLMRLRFQGVPLLLNKRQKRLRSGRFTKSVFRISPLPGMAIHSGNRNPKEASNSRSTSAGKGRPLLPGKTVRFHTPQKRLGKLSSGSLTASAQDKGVVVNKYIKTTTQQQAERIAGGIKQKELVKLMHSRGVTELTAKELAKRYPIDRIEKQVIMLPYRQARDPAAMLVKAIREDWDAPSAYAAALNAEARKRERKEAHAAEEKHRKIHERRLEKAQSELSSRQMQKIAERARREVENNLKGTMGERVPESLVNAQVKKIISDEYLNEQNGQEDKDSRKGGKEGE